MTHDVKGFTLVEVLVVLLIFSVMLTMITFGRGLFSSDSLKVINAYETMFVKMKALQQKALINQAVYRVAFYEDNDYQVEQFDMDKQVWIPVIERLLRANAIDKDVQITYNIQNATDSAEILFQPSGEMTPFRVDFTMGDLVWTLQGTSAGNLVADEKAGQRES